MKAIGTQMHEAGGSLLPPIAAKSEQGTAESFQAALAQAMLGATAAPTFEPRPIAVTLPSVVQPPVPMPIPVAISTPAVPLIPLVPTPVPTLDPAPVPATVLRPTAFFERRPLVATAPAAPAAVAPDGLTPMPPAAPTPASTPTPATTPTFESRPLTPPMPVAVCAAPPAMAHPEESAPATNDQESAPATQAPAAVVEQIVSRVVAPARIDTAMVPAEPKRKSKSDGERAEPMPAPATSDTSAAPVPLPLMARPVPAPSVPLDVASGATPQRLPREGNGSSKTSIDSKPRQASPVPKSDGFEPHALDALLPREHASPEPAAPRAAVADPKPEHDVPVAAHRTMPAGVKVEELQVESAVARPAAPKPPAVAADTKKHDAEPAIGAAGGAGAGSGGNVSSHGQRLGYDAPVGADGPVEMRHAEEPSRPPAPTDRVTLHLPDDAGGGRIQIAVRGDVVHARIVSADEAGMRELQAGADELRSALTRQGFQETHVKVESGRVVADGWQRGAGAGMGAAAAGESAGSGDGRMHDSQQQDRKERHHGAPEDPRSDSRRQQPDGRSQQRARRERER